jgi:hypothetical protein
MVHRRPVSIRSSLGLTRGRKLTSCSMKENRIAARVAVQNVIRWRGGRRIYVKTKREIEFGPWLVRSNWTVPFTHQSLVFDGLPCHSICFHGYTSFTATSFSRTVQRDWPWHVPCISEVRLACQDG